MKFEDIKTDETKYFWDGISNENYNNKEPQIVNCVSLFPGVYEYPVVDITMDDKWLITVLPEHLIPINEIIKITNTYFSHKEDKPIKVIFKDWEPGTWKFNIDLKKCCKIVCEYKFNDKVVYIEYPNNEKVLVNKNSLRDPEYSDWAVKVSGIEYEAFEEEIDIPGKGIVNSIIIYRNGVRVCFPYTGESEHEVEFKKDFCKFMNIPILPLEL